MEPNYPWLAIKAVRKELGWEVGQSNVKDFSRGADHKVFEVFHDGERVIVRIDDHKQIRKYSNKLFAHFWACKEWGKLNVPVPKTIAYSSNSYIIEERIAGTDFDKLQMGSGEKRNLLLQLGRLARIMHRVKTTGYWEIVPPGRGHARTWKRAIDSEIWRNLRLASRHRLIGGDLLLGIKTAYRNNLDILEFADSRLLHGDLNPDNIVINNGRIAGIIDAGDAIAGDPMYDVENIVNWGRNSMDAFYAGYGKHEERRVNFYGMIVSLWHVCLNGEVKRNRKRYKKSLDELNYFTKKLEG